MNLLTLAQERYTAKAYNPACKIAPRVLDALLEQVRWSPSSVNAQPWHFIIVASDEGKARVAPSMAGTYAFNLGKLHKASHAIILCTRTEISSAYLQQLLAQEDQDARFVDQAARAAQDAGRSAFVALHRDQRQDLQHWMEKQVYLALGTLLLGAAALGLDATPMEGFDPQVLDQALSLDDKGLASVVIVALGYRADDDLNARLPKSRLPADQITTVI